MEAESDGWHWADGAWTNRAAPVAAAEIVLAADWAPIRAFAPIMAGAPEAVYGDLLPELRQADLRIVNLECPLVTGGAPVWKSGSTLAGQAGHVASLKVVPFEVATLANNHVFDYGLAGFQETLQILRQNAVRTVGAGLTAEAAAQPLVVEVKGLQLGVVNFSEGEDLTAAVDGPGVSGWEIDALAERVRTLKRQVDVVLAIGHCGVEYIPCPPPYVAQAFQRLAAAGADLVIGHHPHVPQGIQIYHGVPLCYSLGNFVFYQETDIDKKSLFRRHGHPPACLCVSARRQAGTGLK